MRATGTTRAPSRAHAAARHAVALLLAGVALAACGDRTTAAERAAALMREEEAFRADSAAILAALTLDTVLVTWTMPDVAAGDDDDASAMRRDTLHRYLSRSGLCLSTVARAQAGDTLRCPWHRPDSAELDAVLADGVPVTGVHPRPDSTTIAPETPAQYAERLLRALRAGATPPAPGADGAGSAPPAGDTTPRAR